MKKDVRDILSHFSIAGQFSGATPVLTGHINDSYTIYTDGNSEPTYFLQWINSYIFKDVPGLMRNILAVTNHLASRQPSVHENTAQLRLIPTAEGEFFYKDKEENYWRLYNYVPGTHSYDVVDDPKIAYEGGKAFGKFSSNLADLPADQLSDTIPDFHNMETRLAAFFQSVMDDKAGRRKEVEAEIAFVEERASVMLSIPEMVRRGEIPLRITHNDTKFNNILFDGSNHAVCIVDLDTVMPGSILFDFGDAIRTGANFADEDEKDLNKVDINLPIYEAYTRGFIASTSKSLTQNEKDHLAFAARFMTFIIGLRFLTDYLDGDHYFRTLYPDHNLVRARVQFRLVEKMEENALFMENIVQSALDEYVTH
ncbi:MAG TPA: aminoglycoside phosphotransferase family protein [Bacteroidales bacterium]|nr:aminoglycoside phosphotransferase family protein [Bacteroidales bacterium]